MIRICMSNVRYKANNRIARMIIRISRVRCIQVGSLVIPKANNIRIIAIRPIRHKIPIWYIRVPELPHMPKSKCNKARNPTFNEYKTSFSTWIAITITTNHTDRSCLTNWEIISRKHSAIDKITNRTISSSTICHYQWYLIVYQNKSRSIMERRAICKNITKIMSPICRINIQVTKALKKDCSIHNHNLKCRICQ